MSTVRVACLSDTHTLLRKIRVPDAELLIVAGDFCAHGKRGEAHNFADWIHGLPHQHKVIIAGNHDLCLQEDMGLGRRMFQEANEHYLMDREVTVLGLRIYGSPWQPAFHDWAFNLLRNGEALRTVWGRIPADLDILVTHGPPHGILDRNAEGECVGDEVLLAEVEKKAPRMHVFGHIHEGHGVTGWYGPTLFVNASICTRAYAPRNPVQVLDVPAGGLRAEDIRPWTARRSVLRCEHAFPTVPRPRHDRHHRGSL